MGRSRKTGPKVVWSPDQPCRSPPVSTAATPGTDRAAHTGVDERGVPRWIWNAHHTVFTAEWLQELLEAAGFTDVRIESDGGSNLMCWSRRHA